MPEFGEYVSVRAAVAMAGVEQGAVQVVQWGPRLARLVHRGRYQLLDPPPAADADDPDAGDQTAADPGPPPGPAPPAPDDPDPPVSGRRGRGR